ncbi:proline-rich transmembrane protein 4 [Boleophthalmus pectinirostris]|uniref:proline-rich transmembrane protein 4 n=1 Tax=Boleophthalmus pectinirostris TaxID=150288 RepID=UPI00242D83F9|nr:proline-rich transmembrane protein 4 [Boleophthalmus pectinirostris]
MHCLHQTLAFLIWSMLLLQSAADEEAPWGRTKPTTPSKEKPPERKTWFHFLKNRVFGGGLDSNEQALTTAYKGLSQSIDQFEEISGSGHEGISETSESPTTLTQGPATSETHPTRTSNSAHSSTALSDNDGLVSASYSLLSSISSTDSPLTSPAAETTPVHTHTTWGTVQAGTASKGVIDPHLYNAQTDGEVNISEKMSTMADKTTFETTTTLTWATVETPTFSHVGAASTSTHLETKTVTQFATSKSTTTQVLTTQTTQGKPTTEGVAFTAMGINSEPTLESITSTTESQEVNFPIVGELPDEEAQMDNKDGEGEEETEIPTFTNQDVGTGLTDIITLTSNLQTTSLQMSTESPHAYTDWIFSPVESDATFLPDCNKERTGICNISDTWETATSADFVPTQNSSTAINKSNSLFPIPASPLLVPLYTDWNSAMAAWGIAWEVHVYGLGCVFAMLTLASALNLLCLPLRCPSGCGYFALVSLFLLAAGCTRAFSLLYDAYGHLDRLPSMEASLMLYEAPFPCLTAAFGLVFLLLSMRSRMQLSYSAFQRPCFLACLVTLHFIAAFGPETLFKFYQHKQTLCLFFTLVSRGAFVALATFLSSAYFVFYIYVRADSKHIYHLNNTSPTPAERYNRCPFAESRDWDRAAVTVCLSALFSLACAGLQLYAMLNAMGVAGEDQVFHPWSWWTFQFSCRLCELGMCLTLALVVAQPVYCSDHLPAAGSCWTELLASKSPILPGTYQWSLSQQEKLAIVDTVGLGETESLPLYTLMDDRFAHSLNGLDLLYHSNRALAYRDMELNLHSSLKLEDVGGGEPSGGSSFTSDSTTDLRPPSPINLRRSIDEALFSEALFPMSIFSPRPIRCSDQSISDRSALTCNGFSDPLTADPGLYRTSSCVEIAPKKQSTQDKSQEETIMTSLQSPSLTCMSSISSPERWGRSSSSCSLYQASLCGSPLLLSPSPDRHAQHSHPEGLCSHIGSSSDPQRLYQTLGAASQGSLERSSEADRSVQEEFISVCKQIDALSICSETIDL